MGYFLFSLVILIKQLLLIVVVALLAISSPSAMVSDFWVDQGWVVLCHAQLALASTASRCSDMSMH